jgi:hypothetical protein
MSKFSVKQLFIFDDQQPLQMFVTGSTFSMIADGSKDIRNNRIPEAASVEGIKFYQLQDVINGFLNLQQNWDSYNANPISQNAIEGALEVLNQLKRSDIFSKGVEISVFPMRDGGIQFEFDANNLCAELEINIDGEMFYILYDQEANIIDKEKIYSYELSELSNLLEDGTYAG